MSDDNKILESEAMDPVQDPTPEEHTETVEEIRARVEAEVRADFEAMIDRRVSGAQKKWESKQQREAAESLARVNRLRAIEERQRSEEMAVKEHELLVRSTRLDIIDLIAIEEMDSRFRDVIPYEDLLIIKDPVERYMKLKDRIIDIKHEFAKLVDVEVKKQKQIFKTKSSNFSRTV